MKKSIITLLTFVTISIWLTVFTFDDSLKVIACDVGQGDAILIQKGVNQILIDGGPNQKVLDCLGKYMPFWDKSVELVILTHPEEDHYGGLIDVFKYYKVGQFGHNYDKSSSQGYKVLEDMVGSSGTLDLILDTGHNLRLGLIELDILWPEPEQLSSIRYQVSSKKNNNGVVILLKYDQFKALFTADVENDISDKLSTLSEVERINYLKVNHHGSKNGLSQKLLDVTMSEALPAGRQVAVISVGKDNRYGHPSPEVLGMLKNKNIKILRTDEMGDIVY